jgi:hypothetical protein
VSAFDADRKTLLKTSPVARIAIFCGIMLAGTCFFMLLRHLAHPKVKSRPVLERPPLAIAPALPNGRAVSSFPLAPRIIVDTTTDSPGTNLETRVVTLSAEIRGTPPLLLQWKVDKGSGFVPVAASATNSTLTISNAQVEVSGFYALFGTNSAGSVTSTPVPLVVRQATD